MTHTHVYTKQTIWMILVLHLVRGTYAEKSFLLFSSRNASTADSYLLSQDKAKI